MIQVINAYLPVAAGGSGHRYWQLFMPGLNWAISNPGVLAIAEAKAYETVGGSTNALTGSSVTASATFGGQPASNVLDGNASTFWASTGGSNVTMTFDLGAGNEKLLPEIDITGRNDGSWAQLPASGTWRYSDDNSTFTDYFSFTTVPLKTATSTDAHYRIRHPDYASNAGGGAHRFWGLRSNASASSPFISPTEMQLRSSIGGSNIATTGANWLGWSLYPDASGDGSRLVDGNTATECSTQSIPALLLYDFGAGGEVVKPAEISITNFSSFTSRIMTDFDLVYADRLGEVVNVQQNFTTSWSGAQTKTFTVT